MFKSLFANTTTTSIVAVLALILGFGLLFYMVCTNRPVDNTRAVQVITGVLAIIGQPLAYFFGAAKNRTASTGTGTGDVTVNNAQPDNTAP